MPTYILLLMPLAPNTRNIWYVDQNWRCMSTQCLSLSLFSTYFWRSRSIATCINSPFSGAWHAQRALAVTKVAQVRRDHLHAWLKVSMSSQTYVDWVSCLAHRSVKTCHILGWFTLAMALCRPGRRVPSEVGQFWISANASGASLAFLKCSRHKSWWCV